MLNEALVLGARELAPLNEDPAAMDAAIDVVEQITVAHHRGQIREHELRDQGGDSISPVLIELAADDEVATGFHVFTGRPQGVPNNRFIVLLHRQTRQLLALFDYQGLNPLRVGACGGMAARHLAPAGARTAAILGSARQARTQLLALQRTVPTLERARVYSPTVEHRELYAHEMSEALDLPVDPVASAQEAIEGADVISLAHNGRGAALELGWVKPGALIISMTSGQIPPEAMQGARVVGVTWERLLTREPYATAHREGQYAKEAMAGTLGAVIVGEVAARRSTEEIAVFEMTAFNPWSVAVCAWAYQQAVERDLGIPFTLSDE
jgi:ornithine cyclodeaminase/alanine dehydrogenase-like protein (mu-crystallin family)